MNSFDYLWELLSPKAEYANRKHACYEMWFSYTEQQRLMVFNNIKDKMKKGKFVDYNPYFAIQKNLLQLSQRQQMTFDEYYRKFNTTLEQNGWKMVCEEGKQPVYVKDN